MPPPACLEGTEYALKLCQCMSRGNPVLCVITWNGTMQCSHIMLTKEIHVVQELKLKEGHDADWIQCWQHLPPRVRVGFLAYMLDGWAWEQCDGRSGMLPTCFEERQLGLQSQVCRHSAVDVVEHEEEKLLGSGGKHSQSIDKYTPNVAHTPQ